MFNEEKKDAKIDRWHQKRRAFFQPADQSGQRFSQGLEIEKDKFLITFLKWNQDCPRETGIYLLADSVWRCKEVLLTTKRGDSTLFNTILKLVC